MFTHETWRHRFRCKQENAIKMNSLPRMESANELFQKEFLGPEGDSVKQSCMEGVFKDEPIKTDDFVSEKLVRCTVAAEDLTFLFRNTCETLKVCQWIFNGKRLDDVDKKVIDVSANLNAREYEFTVRIPTLITTLESILENGLSCPVDKDVMHTDVYKLYEALVKDMDNLQLKLYTVFCDLEHDLSTLKNAKPKCDLNKDGCDNADGTVSETNSTLFSWNSLAEKMKFYFCAKKNCIGNAKIVITRLKRKRKSLFQVYPELLFDKSENQVIPTFQNVAEVKKGPEVENSEPSQPSVLKMKEVNSENDYLQQKFYTVVQTARYITIILKFKISSVEKNWKNCFIGDELGFSGGKGFTELVNVITECYSTSEYENQPEVSELLQNVLHKGYDCLYTLKRFLENLRIEYDRLLEIQSKILSIL